jgi:hypothetical protein
LRTQPESTSTGDAGQVEVGPRSITTVLEKTKGEKVRHPQARRAAAVAGLLLVIASSAVATNRQPPHDVEIRTLSNRADLVSDGNVLVEVRLPHNLKPRNLTLRLNGKVVTEKFQYDAEEGRLVTVLDGLVEGPNVLVADANGNGHGRPYASLTITNHSRGGPIISGPQLQPWICATKDGAAVTVTVPGTTLSAQATSRVSGLDADPVDAKCNAPAKFTYFYQPKAKEGSACTFTTTGADPCYVAYDVANPPARADIADFTNDRGDTVKNIVRVERGTVNRGMYQLVVLNDPTLPNGVLARQKGWNNKVFWIFGASASESRFQTPINQNTVFNDNALRKGFMVGSASLTDNGTNSNHVLAAETLMMVKEHIIEDYGPIRYTMSTGCSGGSIMQHTISGGYPGLLDGIIPFCSYQDQVNIEMEIKECGLLADRYFNTAAAASLTLDQRSAIAGKANMGFCTVWVTSFLPAYNPTRAASCGAGFPQTLVYDPVLRPNGVRCDLLDHDAGQIGTYVDTDGLRKANKLMDNVGVQYGLKALRDGKISAEDFVLLNEGIGSYNSDLGWSGPAGATAAPRVTADASVLANLYRSGIAGDAHLLARLAIIDMRGDQNPAGDIHSNWRSWGMRARLDQANGHHDNQVIWATTGGIQPGAAQQRRAFLTMADWLDAVTSDHHPWKSRAEKVVANRPARLADGCLPNHGDTDADLTQEVALDSAACPVKFQSSPRQVAGGPISEDIFKCQLKPLNFTSTDYGGATFTAQQQARLHAVFPDGVCDWNQRGVGQQRAPGWYTYQSGRGRPLPPPPDDDDGHHHHWHWWK